MLRKQQYFVRYGALGSKREWQIPTQPTPENPSFIINSGYYYLIQLSLLLFVFLLLSSALVALLALFFAAIISRITVANINSSSIGISDVILFVINIYLFLLSLYFYYWHFLLYLLSILILPLLTLYYIQSWQKMLFELNGIKWIERAAETYLTQRKTPDRTCKTFFFQIKIEC